MSDTPDLWLVQYLCPTRHCLLGGAYDRHVTTREEAEAQVLEAQAAHFGEARCGLCGSRDVHFEHAKLPYDTWEEALPALALVQAANIASRLAIEKARGSTS